MYPTLLSPPERREDQQTRRPVDSAATGDASNSGLLDLVAYGATAKFLCAK